MSKKGFTLTELMISVVIISVAIVAIVKGYQSINTAIQYSKDRAIATNLAQEKVQILKQMLYYKVVPSTSVSYLVEFIPPIPYDNLNFPPETILEAGVYYNRYTYIVPVVEVGGNIIELPPESPDSGMKKITITVVWQTMNRKGKVQISSVYTNRDTVMANASVSGRIRDSSNFLPISGAFINIAEYLGARGVSDNNGNYSISIVPGNYTLYVEARGYFPYYTQISLSPEQNLNLNIDLRKMGYGKLIGYAWLNDHLVISQIVGSTLSPSGFSQEYVEIYNPTTYSWLVNGNIGLRFQRIYDSSKKNISINYIRNYIQPGGFYLFANTTPVIVGGLQIHADAIWSDSNSQMDFPYFSYPSNPNIIPVFGDGADEGGGAIELYLISNNRVLDSVGWNRNDGASGKKMAPFYEGSPIPQNIGLQNGEQYVRYSTTYSVTSSYGPSYDSNNNANDFQDYTSGIVILPRNSLTTLPYISATPAIGAIVSCSDGLSISTFAYTPSVQRPYAYFELNEIATGTWTCSISSSSYALIIDSVSINNGSTVTLNNVFLSSYVSWGYISGMVTDVYGNNINPPIKVSASDGSYTYVSNKRYIIRVSTSPVDIIVNPENFNPSYVSVSSSSVTISGGEIKSGVDFVLYSGGRITGKVFISGSTLPIPGVAVAIYDLYDVARDQQITNNQGIFLSKVLSTGTYIIQPIVDSKEIVIPSTFSVNLTIPGSVIFSTTFTVSNSMGYISGSVYFSSVPIKTGVLIAVTTMSFSGIPPNIPQISSQTLTSAPIYFTSSDEEGRYIVEVRHSTSIPYRVYAYYPHLLGSNFVIYWASRTNVTVWGGRTTGGVNFSW
ncbi:MAG: carboxypeptidase regulatory-like domain-containing protein [Elusimicrobiales bacterium]|nr:carboxypeptidase regulatory-like domain-containing protein [Elusimicrobiales bacterium]